MRKGAVRANQSLLRNGQFSQGWEGWTRAVNPNGCAIEQLSYEGFPINVLSVTNNALVTQNFVVPKDPGENATYLLKFLCESWHPLPGWVCITGEKLSEPLKIEILPGSRTADADTLAFLPTKYEISLNIPIEHGDTLTLSVMSPPGMQSNQVLFFADFLLELHLSPVKILGLTLDDQTHSAAKPLPLCMGVDGEYRHDLAINIHPENIWQGTQGSLTIEDNPQGAIVPNPDWGVDQDLDLSWSFQCPLVDDTKPHPLTLWLWNQYFADPFPVAVLLGHHRLEVSDFEEAAHFPVVDEGESTVLGVQFRSYYTKRSVEGLVVTWTQTGTTVLFRGVTDADGWARCTVTPDVGGTHTYTASVKSLYYTSGVVTRDFVVRALPTSPWKQVRSVVAGVPAPWPEKIGYPNRGSDYLLLILLPPIFVGLGVSLHWRGTSHEQLGVVVSPALDRELEVPGELEILYTLKSEDKWDGEFKLSLSCPKLLKPSPEKKMWLARNEVEAGDKREADRTPVVDEQERALVQVQVVHKLAPGSGEPVQGAMVEFRDPDGTITATRSGSEGWASYWFEPHSAGNHVVTALIRAHAEASVTEVPFDVPAISTSPWGRNVRFLFDNVEVDRKTVGLLCFRGDTHTLKIMPVTSSPWVGRNVSLHWRKDMPQPIGLNISDLEIPKVLLEEGIEWVFSSVEASSLSTMFEVELHCAGESIVRELSGRLMFKDYAKELSVRLDQVAVPLNGQSLYPCLAALQDYLISPHELSPLLGLDVKVAWMGTPAADLKAEMLPAPGTLQPLSAGGVLNALDFTRSDKPGEFRLAVSVPQLGFDATATPMVLDHNKVRIERLREAAVDPVVGMDKAWIGALIVSHFNGLPVPHVRATWTAEGKSFDQETDANGWSLFGYEPKTEGEQAVGVATTSLFDQFEDSRQTAVNVLSVDPWDGVRAHFDGQPGRALGKQTLFPRTETQHVLEVSANDGNVLKGRTLALGMSLAGPDARGFLFEPTNTLGKPRLFTEVLRYPFRVGNAMEGSCRFRLAAERLARLSPEINLSVGAGSKVWQISATTRTTPTLYWGETFIAEVKVISSVSQRAMVGVPVEFRGENGTSFNAVTNFYGVAKYSFVPTIPGAREVTAKVGDGEFSDGVKLSYIVLAPRKVESFTSPETSAPVGTKVSADIRIVSFLDGQPLEGVGVKWLFLDFVFPPSKTDADGRAHLEFRLPGMKQALLEAVIEGGIAGSLAKHIEFTVKPNV
jgi:hypothetical protein